MPPMQHEQRAVAIESHAERMAANMGEDFRPLVIRREEAHDVAWRVPE